MWRVWLLAIVIFWPQVGAAQTYGGMGVGAAEYCDGAGGAFFLGSGGCELGNFAVRGVFGSAIEDYLRLEGSFDVHLDPLTVTGLQGRRDSNESAAIIGGHALVIMPFGPELQVFFGPSLGVGMYYVSEVEMSYVSPDGHARFDYTDSQTDFSVTYGWTLGLEYETANRNLLRLQWQTWNGHKSSARDPKAFSSNGVFVLLMRAY